MSKVIIITGMHRSGTSLVSSLLQRSGIHIGEKLLAANIANPRGYFEDVDFYEFQEKLLHARDQTYLHVDFDFAFEPTEAETRHAQELIAARAHRPVWGWKDPRTSLLLPFWHQQLPEARFLFVYRHPLEVLLSLLRRGEFDSHPSLVAGMSAWQTYNSRIKSFHEQWPDRCLLVQIDGIVKQPARFFELAQSRLQLTGDVDPKVFDEIYHSNELRKTKVAPALVATLRSLCPGSLELYDQLNGQAALCELESQSESESTEHLAPLAEFVKNLKDPVSIPVKYSLLQLLMSSVAPELTEQMLVKFDATAQAAQKRADQMWMYAQHLQRLNENQTTELTNSSARIDSLTADLAGKSADWERGLAEIESLKSELAGKSARVEGLTADLAGTSARVETLAADLADKSARVDSLTADLDRSAAQIAYMTKELSRGTERITTLTAEVERDAARIDTLMSALERDTERIESLVAELNTIRSTFVWKMMTKVRTLKHRSKKVA